jgi:hypothetical protein
MIRINKAEKRLAFRSLKFILKILIFTTSLIRKSQELFLTFSLKRIYKIAIHLLKDSNFKLMINGGLK